jgi:hypothetical protein
LIKLNQLNFKKGSMGIPDNSINSQRTSCLVALKVDSTVFQRIAEGPLKCAVCGFDLTGKRRLENGKVYCAQHGSRYPKTRRGGQHMKREKSHSRPPTKAQCKAKACSLERSLHKRSRTYQTEAYDGSDFEQVA